MTSRSTDLHRAGFDLDAHTLDDRRVAMSFSSETPVLRDEIAGVGGPAYEVLGHADGEVDLTGLEPGRAPLLLDHERRIDAQIGVIESVEITNGRGRAVARIARTVRAMKSSDASGTWKSLPCRWVTPRNK